MRINVVYLFLLSLVLAGCRGDSAKSISSLKATANVPMCRVYFGAGDEHSIVIGRTEDQLLIHRDGDLNSAPDTYAMPSNRLDDASVIKPFKFGDVSFTFTACTEYKDTEPTPSHSMMLFVDVKSDGVSFAQYCEVPLSTEKQNLAIARFDGPLTIGSPTNNFELEPIVFEIGGEATDVRSLIGTINKDDGCWTVVAVHANGQCDFPDQMRPEVVIEFPAVDGKTIRQEVALTEFC